MLDNEPSVVPKKRANNSHPKKTHNHPEPTARKSTSKELFGSDSEDAADEMAQTNNKGICPLNSCLVRRIQNGVARQANPDKAGSHYVDLKVYRCDEIEKVTPLNRWRQSVVSLKYRTNDDTVAWGHLADFINAARKEFKGVPPTFNAFYNNNNTQ